MKTEYLTMREMCEQFGVTPRTLRYYEAKELLFPERDGTKRLFTYGDQVRTKLILRGKRFGFSLEEIGTLLNLYDKGDQQQSQLKETFRLGQMHLEELAARRLELNAAISDLQVELDIAAKRLESIPSDERERGHQA